MKKKENKFMTTVKVGPKGQIVIPKEVRDMFSLEAGSSLILLADAKRGIALNKASFFEKMANAIFAGSYESGEEIAEADGKIFAALLQEEIEAGDSNDGSEN